MDIIDVILGSALTPQGEIESFAARAEKAVTDANTVLNNIESITDQTNANNAAAQEALSTVNTALTELEDATIDLVNDEVKKLAIELTTVSNQDNSIGQRFTVHYPDSSTQVINNVAKYYTNSGNNVDGTMTQRAITEAIRTAVNSIVIPSTNLGAQNANKIVIVGPDGTIIPSANVTEESIMNGTHGGGSGGGDTPTPTPGPATGVVGVKINYNTAIIIPTDDAINATTMDFNNFKMYGGRIKCLVDDTGAIVAFYGDSQYTDTPSNGYQVMIYQPKFYYKRTPSLLTTNQYGTAIKEEVLQLSDTLKTGYKLHPLFIDENGAELEYALLSAYEGSIEAEDNSYLDVTFTDFLATKLSSVSDAKPISGVNNTLNAINAEKLASNRGYGWHITTSKALSDQQMLMLVEFNALNVQISFNDGISRLASGDNNSTKGAQTGATKILGNQTGQASSTSFYYDNNTYTETETGKVSIAYRGYENPWGNMWDYIGDLVIKNNSSTNHTLYMCNNYNYSENITNNYIALPFTPPPTTGWISAFAYDTEYDWLFLPIECNSNANSLTPIGDHFFGARTNTGVSTCINGGPWFGEDNNGIFYYTFDRKTTESGGKNVGARLLHIPQATSSIYINNVIKWNTKMGG